MIDIVNNKQNSFRNLAELKDNLANRTRNAYRISLSELSLDEQGMLRSDRFEGRLAASAYNGLLNLCELPDQFARRCPPDLLCPNVKTLSRVNSKPVRVELVDGVITTIRPLNRNPISNVIIVDWLDNRQIKAATTSGSYLQITSLTKESEELLPGDEFTCGWELTNDEDGWRPLQAQQYVVREICTNGQLGFDKTASFSRSSGSHENIAKSLERLGTVLDNMPVVERLAEAVKWADEQQVGTQRDNVVRYLTQRLDGRTTREILEEITSDSTWYDLLNKLTSSAQSYELDMRRRYEREGGRMLDWYRSQGRGRAPWRKVSCEQCEYLPAD